MKITQLSFSDSKGGAARAAYRIHRAMIQMGLDSTMMVNHANSGDPTVYGPSNKISEFLALNRSKIGSLVPILMRSKSDYPRSFSILPSGLAKRLNQIESDLLHLHWVNGEMLSISEIGKLTKPLIWTFHDMWPFCGAEHYTYDLRWQAGYSIDNRPSQETGLDLNRWIWRLKEKCWQEPINIVTPSEWLANCVRSSPLMSNWPVSVIPNPIDINRWFPLEGRISREILGLPYDVPLILFGAMGGSQDFRKGFDLLLEALSHTCLDIKDLHLVILGEMAPINPKIYGFPVHYMGHLYDDFSLSILYSAVDLMVVPSRLEPFGQTASEAHACGTPVVAFSVGGLTDIIEHKKTGYLAMPFHAEDLADGIRWVIENSKNLQLGENARKRVLNKFSYDVVGAKYSQLYRSVL